MPSVADAQREESRRRVLALTPEQRIEEAFRLGEADVELYGTAHGLEPGEARLRLRQARQAGRRPSCGARKESS